MKFRVYRYNPDTDHKPRMEDYEIRALPGMMLREALLEIKRQDEILRLPPLLRRGGVRVRRHERQRHEPAWPASPWSPTSRSRSRSAPSRAAR